MYIFLTVNKCTWVEHNLTFIRAAISRSVTPSSFYLFENKNVSNLDTNLINEASSLSVTGNLCPWNSFFLIKQNNYPSFYFYCILNLLTGIQTENVTILHELYVYTPVPWYDKTINNIQGVCEFSSLKFICREIFWTAVK